MEVDVAKGRRDWAFSERDKVKYRKIFYYMNNYLHAFKHLEKSAFYIYPKLNTLKNDLLNLPNILFARMTS